MNMYEAMKQTAAHIKGNPAQYSFAVVSIPRDGGEGREGMGCMLGRLAQIAGYNTTHANNVAAALLGISVEDFFSRVAMLIHGQPYCPNGIFDDPIVVNAALGAYAEKYRAELQAREWPPEGIPTQVREIFAPKPAQYKVDAIFGSTLVFQKEAEALNKQFAAIFASST
jgi:hypothetical protein